MCTRPSKPRPRRDRDVQNFLLDETETRRLKSQTRPKRDVAVSETLVEPPKLSRVSEASTSRRDVFRDVGLCMVKHIGNEKIYGLINSHHGKRFLFVILWVVALYFDNCR